ncbi:uncharacterized protein [Dermacentor andersoni]|uniref:uncharacterized protein isoform X3 n=1 Tax=Dermacentor andersoni TaxID=34620 RepID=UPI003B3A563B
MPSGPYGCIQKGAEASLEEWPTSQLTQRICLQQQGMSQQMVEVGLAAVGEDLQAVAEALHTCQAAHAQVDITMMAGKRGKNMKQQKKKSRPCHPAKVADQRSCIRHGKKNCGRCHCKFFSCHSSPDVPAHGPDTIELPAEVSIGLGGHPAEYDCTILLNLTCPSELQGIPNLYNTVAERNVLFCIASLQKA